MKRIVTMLAVTGCCLHAAAGCRPEYRGITLARLLRNRYVRL